jgi:adenine-specific DNA-methyltransferase
LTWTNKHLRLLAHEDGSYEWVPPADFRVAEVRLLDEAGTTGEVREEDERAKDNLLIRGDALSALTSLTKIPEFRDEYVGKVKLIYIDPPFNTGQAFEHYDDALEHSVWLTMMRDRLTKLKKLLAADGSIWVHLDDVEMHRCRAVLDEVFGAENFVGVIIWEKADSPRMDAQWFSTRHDYLIVYGKTDAVMINGFSYNSGEAAHYNKRDDKGRPYYLKPLRAMGGQGSTREARPTLWYPLTAPDGTEVWPKLTDGGDGAWRWKPSKVEDDAHLIEWIHGARGFQPYFRIYGKEDARRPPETIWLSGEVGSNRTSKAEIKKLFPAVGAFSTPKPERLMERVIHIATNPGDIVLDCFAGSGTTAAVSHKMRRRWITCEWNRETLETFTGPRLARVAAGEDPGGISESVGWEGGGGFRVLDVAPSMFEDDEGHVVLADWASNGALAEAVAAQLGFAYDREMLPFCGRKGRSRLAVVDGLVNEDVARLLVEQLPENEMLVMCATMIDPAAQAIVSEARKGSQLRKIPDSILADYRRTQLWWEHRMTELYAPQPESEPERTKTAVAAAGAKAA